MKAVICYESGDIHIHTFSTEWTPCSCGNCKAKWLDPNAGTVVVAARNRDSVRLLGLHNGYLIDAIRARPGGRLLTWEEYRELHDVHTEAPGYLFDKSKISCWAAVVTIGRSNDVRWATEEEMLQAFPDLAVNSDSPGLDQRAPGME